MATQEERLSSLESFRTETLFAYKDMAYRLTMVQGLTEDAIGRLAVLQRDVSEIKALSRERFEHVESLLHAHTELLNMILERLPEKE